MKAVDFQQSNDTLKAPTGQENVVSDLPIYRDSMQVISCWALDAADLSLITRTKRVYLSVMGSTHPPLALIADAFDWDPPGLGASTPEPEPAKSAFNAPEDELQPLDGMTFDQLAEIFVSATVANVRQMVDYEHGLATTQIATQAGELRGVVISSLDPRIAGVLVKVCERLHQLGDDETTIIVDAPDPL